MTVRACVRITDNSHLPQTGVHFGRKRTLAPLPAAFAERCKTPASGFNIEPLLSSLDVSFIAEWLARCVHCLHSSQIMLSSVTKWT